MSNRTVPELKVITKKVTLCGFYKLKKDDLIALLTEQLIQIMPTSTPRAKEHKKDLHAMLIPNSEEIEKFEEQQLAKSKPVVKKHAE